LLVFSRVYMKLTNLDSGKKNTNATLYIVILSS
jgi:hypothetical protein